MLKYYNDYLTVFKSSTLLREKDNTLKWGRFFRSGDIDVPPQITSLRDDEFDWGRFVANQIGGAT